MMQRGFWKRLVQRMRAKSSARTRHSNEFTEYSPPSKNRKRFRKFVAFDPDNDVFHLMVVLTLLFMVLYVFGTSIPSWYVLQEPVSNFTSCTSADYYVNKLEREARVTGETFVSISSSLWYVKIQVFDSERTYSRYMPYVSLTQIPSSRGLLINPQPTRGLMCMITFTLLALGIVFAFRASLDPPGQIFYGLSSLVITTGITAWLLIAMPSGQDLTLSVAYDLCIYKGTMSTSLFLQMTTGACAIIAFLFSCVLLHLAVMTRVNYAKRRKKEDFYDYDI